MITYYVYIITNKNNTTLYVGVTNDLERRMEEHFYHKDPKSFSARYNLNKLVYVEEFNSIDQAIAFEKKLKAGNRKRKIELIEVKNPSWISLFEYNE